MQASEECVSGLIYLMLLCSDESGGLVTANALWLHDRIWQ